MRVVNGSGVESILIVKSQKASFLAKESYFHSTLVAQKDRQLAQIDSKSTWLLRPTVNNFETLFIFEALNFDYQIKSRWQLQKKKNEYLKYERRINKWRFWVLGEEISNAYFIIRLEKLYRWILLYLKWILMSDNRQCLLKSRCYIV